MTANLFGPDLGYVVLVAVVVLLFGSQLPKIARNIGIAGKEFRKAQQEADDEDAARKAAGTAGQTTSGAATQPQPPPPAAIGSSDDQITLTKAQLDALLRAREEQTGSQQGGHTTN